VRRHDDFNAADRKSQGARGRAFHEAAPANVRHRRLLPELIFIIAKVAKPSGVIAWALLLSSFDPVSSNQMRCIPEMRKSLCAKSLCAKSLRTSRAAISVRHLAAR
jgi:hypothetical protein